jgi:hypothetical protein
MRSFSVFLLISPSGMVDGIQMYIRLWTWQAQDIELTDYTVDHTRSEFVSEYPKYPDLCKRLAETLGINNQFIWCFTQDEKRWDGRKKWQITVPKECARLICSITWDSILKRSKRETERPEPPDNLYYNTKRFYEGFDILAPNRTKFNKTFIDAWKNKTTEELWGMIAVNEVGEACTHALVLLPIEEGWITRDLKIESVGEEERGNPKTETNR